MGFRIVILGVLIFGSYGVFAAENDTGSHMLGKGKEGFSLRDIPDGKFRRQLDALPRTAQVHALKRLKSFAFPAEDVDSLNADNAGDIFYACAPEADNQTPSKPLSQSGTESTPLPISPLPASIVLHSNPGSTNILLLDFNGHDVEGTVWNESIGRTTIPATSFSLDGDFSTFSDNEQLAIQRVWQRVAEDYAPFDVDVTTVQPTSMNSRVLRVLITRSTDYNGDLNPWPDSGGVSYVGYFAHPFYDYYAPSWVYVNNISYNEGNIAEAASHEAGHFFGLSHDGQTGGTTYYSGHGTGETSWGAIMGKSYGRNVSQWSKGEYLNANNLQDDLAILSGKLGYKADDHGDAITNSTPLTLISNMYALATTPETDPDNAQPQNKGIIAPTDAGDVWTFASGAGDMSLFVNPWISPGNTRGNNLDIKASLLDSNGTVVAVSDATNRTGASFELSVSAGTYFIRVEKSSMGNPESSTPDGYTDYDSCGQYFITGAVQAASEPVPSIPSDLMVTIAPTEAVNQGGAWKIIGHPNTNWLDSGITVSNLTAGDYTVAFKAITNWTEPSDEIISLSPGQTGIVNAVYTEIVTDAYGIPLWWLVQNGYTNDPEVAVTLIASNGMAVWETYIAGVDPNDPDSAFVLDVSDPEPGGEVILSWQAVQGRIYSIFQGNEPGDALQPIPDAQNIAWPRNSYTNQPGSTHCQVLQIQVELE